MGGLKRLFCSLSACVLEPWVGAQTARVSSPSSSSLTGQLGIAATSEGRVAPTAWQLGDGASFLVRALETHICPSASAQERIARSWCPVLLEYNKVLVAPLGRFSRKLHLQQRKFNAPEFRRRRARRAALPLPSPYFPTTCPPEGTALWTEHGS